MCCTRPSPGLYVFTSEEGQRVVPSLLPQMRRSLMQALGHPAGVLSHMHVLLTRARA